MISTVSMSEEKDKMKCTPNYATQILLSGNLRLYLEVVNWTGSFSDRIRSVGSHGGELWGWLELHQYVGITHTWKRREHKKVSVVYVTQHLCLISESTSHATVIEVQVWYTAWVRVSTRAIPANTCTNGTAVTACIRARELTSTRAVNDFLHSPAHIQQAITCRAIARFPDRWKRAVQRNADRLVWLLISRAIDNAHMIRNKAHKRMRVITQFTISLPSIVFNFFALRTVAKKQENTHVASRYQIKRRKK